MIYKRGKWYWMDDMVNGQRYRLPLETRNWQEALNSKRKSLSKLAMASLAAAELLQS